MTDEQAWDRGAHTSHVNYPIAPKVVGIGDITGLPVALPTAYSPDSTMASCTSTSQDVTTTGNAIASDAAESSGAQFVDVQDLVCAHDRRPLVVDDIVTYHNEGHITRSWSRSSPLSSNAASASLSATRTRRAGTFSRARREPPCSRLIEITSPRAS